jgi:hypothetical protein
MAGYNLSVRLLPDTVKTLGFAAIGVPYMGVGTAFAEPIRIIDIQNLTNQSVMFSFDGINDHLPLPINGYLILDVTSNKSDKGSFYIAEGTRIYVRQLSGAPTSGSVYVTGFYGQNS